jgi:HSP20 family protein
MKLTRFDPMRELERISDRMNRMMNLAPLGAIGENLTLSDWSPSVDIAEDDKTYIVTAEIPGVRKEDVKVTLDEDHLVISGERKEEKEEKDKRFHRVERAYGSFRRSFTLPDDVDADKIDARFEAGLLHVHLPKTQKRKTHGKEIRIS